MHGYIGKLEFLAELRQELQGHCVAEHGDLLLSDELLPAAFAVDIWPDVQQVSFESISKLANAFLESFVTDNLFASTLSNKAKSN